MSIPLRNWDSLQEIVDSFEFRDTPSPTFNIESGDKLARYFKTNIKETTQSNRF